MTWSARASRRAVGTRRRAVTTNRIESRRGEIRDVFRRCATDIPMRAFLCWTMPLVFAAACGDGDDTCDVAANTGCGDGEVCERVVDGEPTCFAPVAVRGRVIDLASNAPVAGARVVALDPNGAAVSDIATTGVDGRYALQVPAQRASDGTPSAFQPSLRADAPGYQTFPGGVRQALPLDVTAAVRTEAAWVLESALTDLGMLALPAGAGAGVISGTVEVPSNRAGILVVAEAVRGGRAVGESAIADRNGNYAILNVVPGHYAVTAYARGAVYTAIELDLSTAATANLSLADTAASEVSGQISIVNGGGGTGTSVVMFVESTFDEATGRGAAPPGFRAPEAGPPSISGAFSLAGVPPGRYVMVAAFENDLLVRDPDLCISGTDTVHVEVLPGQPLAIGSAFKITGALEVFGPGAERAEAIASTPTLRWADDSSSEDYDLQVLDAFGTVVWATTVADTNRTLEILYGGPPLSPGMYYQFRATSFKSNGGGERCALSRTEDLRGVFYVP